MKVNQRQQQARKNISKLETLIHDAIDEYCKGKGIGEYGSVSYAEIKASLLRVLTTFNESELESLWEK